ncbi:MAG: dehypoxanthine futalosine cyclase, partial [bacterium]
MKQLAEKALAGEFLSVDEGTELFAGLLLPELMFIGNELRKKQRPGKAVTWIIDRNVNSTN